MTFYVESGDKQSNLYDIQGVLKKLLSLFCLTAACFWSCLLMISRSEAARQTGESLKAIFWETLYSKKEQINNTENILHFFSLHYRLQQIPNLSYMAVVECTKYGQVGYPWKDLCLISPLASGPRINFVEYECPKKVFLWNRLLYRHVLLFPFLLIFSYSYFSKFGVWSWYFWYFPICDERILFFGSIPISIQSSAASGSIYTFSKLCSYSRLVHVPFMFVQWNKSCAESILSISHQLVEY